MLIITNLNLISVQSWTSILLDLGPERGLTVKLCWVPPGVLISLHTHACSICFGMLLALELSSEFHLNVLPLIPHSISLISILI